MIKDWTTYSSWDLDVYSTFFADISEMCKHQSLQFEVCTGDTDQAVFLVVLVSPYFSFATLGRSGLKSPVEHKKTQVNTLLEFLHQTWQGMWGGEVRVNNRVVVPFLD